MDALIGAVVLITAAGFRFLAQRHLQDAGAFGAAEVVVAVEVVAIPLALAAMVVAARGTRWRDLGLTAGTGGAAGVLATLAAAALLLLLRPPPLTLPVSPAMAVVAPLLVVGEELLRRGFLLNEISAMFGGGTLARGGALGALGLTEALAHTPAGASAALAAGLSDVVLGALYLAAGRSLLAPVLARGLAYAG